MLRFKVARRRTLSILAFLTIGACFVVYGSLIRGTASNSGPANSKKGPTLTSGTVTAKLEVELITLQTSGFEPTEIVRSKGPFVLLIDDRSRKENSSFSLQSLKGESVRDINTKRVRSEWHDVINLPPGDYVLTNPANPDSRCQITIMP